MCRKTFRDDSVRVQNMVGCFAPLDEEYWINISLLFLSFIIESYTLILISWWESCVRCIHCDFFRASHRGNPFHVFWILSPLFNLISEKCYNYKNLTDLFFLHHILIWWWVFRFQSFVFRYINFKILSFSTAIMISCFVLLEYVYE